MKIKKSDLKRIVETLEEVEMFTIGFLDFADDDQIEYVKNLLDDILEKRKLLENSIMGD